MKRNFVIGLTILAFAFVFPAVMEAQVAKQGNDVLSSQLARDPDLEKDSMHNLEVARQYFKLRKAYVAALQRCEEIIAGDPAFSKIDEVLYMAGESSMNLAQGKGKQKPSLYVIHEGESKRTLTPEEFRDLARDYLSQLVNDHPQSSYRAQAGDELKSLGGAKPKQ